MTRFSGHQEVDCGHLFSWFGFQSPQVIYNPERCGAVSPQTSELFSLIVDGVDKDGNLAYDGAIDDAAEDEGDPRKARNYVKEAVNKLLADQKVEVSKTKPYGCSVKY